MKHEMILVLFLVSCSLQAQQLDVEGNARIEGKLNIFNAIGDSSIFIGANAGLNDVGFNQNTFVGNNAGLNNTGGRRNSFLGQDAGRSNTSGSNNSFFGRNAGRSNTMGLNNSFFGNHAGNSNTTGYNNSFLGNYAGNSNTTGFNNSFFGNDAGNSNTTGSNNSFFGRNAGRSNTTGFNNSFFGYDAGRHNATGLNNSFFGYNAGEDNTNGQGNSFFGHDSGNSNTTGNFNSFFGHDSGKFNTTGFRNSFFGQDAGTSNTTGLRNSFFGQKAGISNSTGNYNSFIGSNAGLTNTTGFSNSFFGEEAGSRYSAGVQNTFLGADSDATMDSLSFAIAIGSNARVGCSNCAVIGGTGSNAVKVGIGLTSPTQELSIRDVDNSGNVTINLEKSGNAMDLSLTSSGGSLQSSDALELGVNNTGILFLQADRKVGLGTGVPGADLHIAAGNTNTLIGDPGCATNTFAGIGFQGTLDCTNYALLGNATQTFVNVPSGGSLGFRVGNQSFLSISSAGHVKVHSLAAAGSEQLCRNSNGQIAPCSSSLRYKKNVQSYSTPAGLIQALQPVSYEWKDSHVADIGLIAEAVANVDPRLVTYNEEGMVEGVKYDRLGVILLDVVQRQETLLSSQQAQIETLERMVLQLQQKTQEQSSSSNN